MTMYILSNELRNFYENLSLPVLLFQRENNHTHLLAVSEGFLKKNHFTRTKLAKHFRSNIEDFLLEGVHPDEAERLKQITNAFLTLKSDYDIIFRARQLDGYHMIHAVGYWQDMPDGGSVALISYNDLEAYKSVAARLRDQYTTFQHDEFFKDSLTDLPNLNYLHKYADIHVNDMLTSNKIPVLFYFDVDSMQSYNNQYGFRNGDDLLRLIAGILCIEFPHGMVVRAADDHFIVIDEFTSEEAIGKKITQINYRIKNEAFGNTTGIHAGICVHKEGMTTTQILDNAKQANKIVNENLNVCYCFFSSDEKEEYLRQRYIVENFYNALSKGWIRIYYQCFLRLETDKGYGFEALSRWIDPVRGVIPPNDFIPALERYHLMHELDLYMFEMVCREVKVRFDAGLPLLPVSINFSRQDFDYIDVPSELNRIVDSYHIEKYGIDKSFFIIEITEQDMAVATAAFYEQLQKIRDSGFGLWVDDFGSGYSSLNVFSRFEIDLIKFDMDLLRDLDSHNGANREILTAMIKVAKRLGIHTLCEGMETEEQKQFLIEVGCELAQGYLYHKPEPLETIFYRLGIGLPIPAWESTPEREEMAKKWSENIADIEY